MIAMTTVTLALAGDTMLGRGVAERITGHPEAGDFFSADIREHLAEAIRDEALAAQAKLPPDPVGDFYQGGTFCSAEFTADAGKVWE